MIATADRSTWPSEAVEIAESCDLPADSWYFGVVSWPSKDAHADYFPLHEANATYEATPGRSSGHLQGLLEAPLAKRQAFLDDPRGSWDTSPSGRDVGYTAAQMLPGETSAGTGRFGAATNPARVP